MSLQETIDLFTQVNKDCLENGECIVPFSSDPDIIDFYEDQMENLEFEQEEIDAFKSWLQSLDI